MRVMPWEGSGRYSPGPGMVKLLEKWFYQELRPLMAICSLNPPGNLAIVSHFSTFYGPSVQAMDTQLGARHRRRTPTIHRGRAQRTMDQRLQHQHYSCNHLAFGPLKLDS